VAIDNQGQPVSGVGYPRTPQEFYTRFATEAHCRKYLPELRWPSGLQRVLGLGSYQTVWTWMRKLRRAMVRPEWDHLTGAVEVDEAYFGGQEEEVHGRETEDKAIVVIAEEIRRRKIGCIRLQRIKDFSSESLLPFVQEVVVPGSLVRLTARHFGYSPDTISRWARSYGEEVITGLEPRSRRPRRVRQSQTPLFVVKRIQELREQHPR
jgi:transposase-like protein